MAQGLLLTTLAAAAVVGLSVASQPAAAIHSSNNRATADDVVRAFRREQELKPAGARLDDAAYARELSGRLDSDTQTALDAYVAKPDSVFNWFDTGYNFSFPDAKNASYTGYFFNLTSLTYLSPAMTDRSVWSHEVVYIIPKKRNPACKTAFIWLTWGKNGKREKWNIQDDVDIMITTQAALDTGCPAVAVYQIPNENICFYDDPAKTFCGSEDDAIAYTFNRYLYQNRSIEWLMLFPMAKAGVRAMDAVQEISRKVFDWPVDDFVVSGASKRGWTTWLVGAVDPLRAKRIRAIIPVVLDAINFRSFLRRQWQSYNAYTFALGSYVNYGLADATVLPLFDTWCANIDPYFYRNRLTLPKLAINAVGDEFQLLEDQATWAHDMPGEMKTMLIKDADHLLLTNIGLVLKTFTAFYNSVVNVIPRPSYTWSIDSTDGTISVTTSEEPHSVKIIYASAPASSPYRNMRDYRDIVLNSTEPCLIKVMGGCVRFVFWSDKKVAIAKGQTTFSARVPPPSGNPYTGFYIQLEFLSTGSVLSQYYASPASILPLGYPFPPCDPAKGECLKRYV